MKPTNKSSALIQPVIRGRDGQPISDTEIIMGSADPSPDYPEGAELGMTYHQASSAIARLIRMDAHEELYKCLNEIQAYFAC